MSYAYATTNLLTGLAAASFTPTGGPSDATRAYLNDGRMDKTYNFSATASTVKLVIDLGSATDAKCLALLNSNIYQAVNPTILIEAADDAAITVNVVTPKAATTPGAGTGSPAQKDVVLQFVGGGVNSKRYWRITWAWSGTFTLTLGELFMALITTQLARGSAYGSGESEQYFDVSNEMMYGDTRAYLLGGPVRSKMLKFSDFSAADKLEHRIMWTATKNRTGTLLWIESYEATSTAAAIAQQECIFGRIWQPNPWTWTQDDFGVYTPSELEIRSLGREVGA